MTMKTELRGRITARAPQPVVDELEEAAALVGVTVNQFIVQAASEKARTIIDSFTRIELTRRDAVFIANLIDAPPPPNAALKRAVQRYEKAVNNGGVSPNRRKFRHAKSEPAADTRMISLFWSWSALGRFSALQVSRQYDRRVPKPARQVSP